MPFTYDVTTTVGQIRLLIGDTVITNANFQDEEISAVLTIVTTLLSGGGNHVVSPPPSNELWCETCAYLLDSLAARVASSKSGRTVQLGDYKLTGKDQVDSLRALAQAFRDAINNTPAFGTVEENLSAFNELNIIRNFVLRTEL